MPAAQALVLVPRAIVENFNWLPLSPCREISWVMFVHRVFFFFFFHFGPRRFSISLPICNLYPAYYSVRMNTLQLQDQWRLYSVCVYQINPSGSISRLNDVFHLWRHVFSVCIQSNPVAPFNWTGGFVFFSVSVLYLCMYIYFGLGKSLNGDYARRCHFWVLSESACCSQVVQPAHLVASFGTAQWAIRSTFFFQLNVLLFWLKRSRLNYNFERKSSVMCS